MDGVYGEILELDTVRGERFGETIDVCTMSLLDAMKRRLFFAGAFTIYVTPHMDALQEEYMRILKDKCETLVWEDSVERFVNENEDVDFFQIVEMGKGRKLQSYFVHANEFMYEVASSLQPIGTTTDEWKEWRSKVVLINNIPEFLLTFVIQLEHEYVDRIFPLLKQVYYTLEDPVFDGVCPRASTLKVVQKLAKNVDMGEWIKMYYIDRGNSYNSESSQSSSAFMSSLGASSPASTAFMLIPSMYKDIRSDVVISLMCNILADIHGNDLGGTMSNGESKYQIPKGFQKAPHAIHTCTNAIRENVSCGELPTEITNATRALVKKYRGVGHRIQDMEPFQKVFTVFAQTTVIEYKEAVGVIRDICGADNLAATEKDGTYLFLRGRYLGLEYENSYMHQGEEGVGGLIRFLRMIGVPRFSIDYVDHYAWYQMDNGLMIHMPSSVTDRMRQGGALFCSYMFPVPGHIGHPLLRYVSLGRILCTGDTEEFLWGVSTLLFHMSGDFEASIEIGRHGDAIDLVYIRSYIGTIIPLLLSVLTGTRKTMDMKSLLQAIDVHSVNDYSVDMLAQMEALDGGLFLLVLRVFVSLCVCWFADRKEIEKRFTSDALGEIDGMDKSRFIRRYVMLLRTEIRNVETELTEEAYFLKYVDAWCLISSDACSDHSFGDKTYSLLAVKESVLQHSSTDKWKTLPSNSDSHDHRVMPSMTEKEMQEVMMAVSMRFESALCSIPFSRLKFHYTKNMGACGVPLQRIRIPLFRTYNALDPLTYEHQCIPMARIGDITDPIVRLSEVEKYYTEKGHVYNRLHPSVFYGCNPALLSDILCHRAYCASPDSPVVTTQKKTTGFENDIHNLYNTTMGIVRQKLFKRKFC